MSSPWVSRVFALSLSRLRLLVLLLVFAALTGAGGCGDDGGGARDAVDGTDGSEDLGGVDTIEPCPTSGAKLQAAPLVVEFGPIAVGMTQTRDIQVNSGGTGQLCLAAMDFTLDPVGSPFLVGPLSVDGVPVAALNPGMRGAMTITFMPSAAGSGITTLTLGSENGGSASITLSWQASAPVLPLGSANVGFVTTYVFDGARFDSDPAYAATHPEGISQVQVFSGAFGDGGSLPSADAMATMAVAKHYAGAQPTLVVEQRSFADTEKTTLANPQAVLVLPDDVQQGTYAFDLDKVGDPTAPLLVVFNDDGAGGRCALAVASGSLLVGQAVNTTADEGGAVAVTAGGVQLYAPYSTPFGDVSAALSLVGWSTCAD